MAAEPVVRTAGEGERRAFYGGGVHTWKVTSEDTDGAFFLFEDALTQGKMTPWHCHPGAHEAIYVLEGEVDVNVDGNERRVTAGALWMAPRGVPHAFSVVSRTARLLTFQTPGSAQRFYWDASEPTTSGASDVGDVGPVDLDCVRRVATATGVTAILGPPPFGGS